MNQNIFLLLGTNVGDKIKHLVAARNSVEKISKITKASSIFKTQAWGKTDQAEFYNQVVEINSLLPPQDLLLKILAIENELGRERNEKWGPRIIDIDILFYQNQIIEHENLIVPHPGIPFRRFTLVPLNEIAPDFVHPALNKNMRTLLEDCTDPLMVEIVNAKI